MVLLTLMTRNDLKRVFYFCAIIIIIIIIIIKTIIMK